MSETPKPNVFKDLGQVNREELLQRSKRISHALVSSPSLIGSFVASANTHLLYYQDQFEKRPTEGRSAYVNFVRLLGETKTFFDMAARDQIYRDLTPMEIRDILLSLPDPEKKFTLVDEVALDLATLFIRKRFEISLDEGDPYKRAKTEDQKDKVRRRGWRGSIRNSWRTMRALEMEDGIDLQAAKVWFDIIVGKYPQISSKGIGARSLPWRAEANGVRSADPLDESIFAMAVEIDMNQMLLAEVLGRRDEIQQNSRDYTALYKPYYDDAYALALGLIHPKEQGRVARDLPPDLKEVARKAVENKGRYAPITKMLEEGYQELQVRKGMYAFTEAKDRTRFPYTVTDKIKSPVKSKLLALIPASARKAAIRAEVQRHSSLLGPHWQVIEFNRPGIAGYLIVDEQVSTGEKEQRVLDMYLHRDARLLLDKVHIEGEGQAGEVVAMEGALWYITRTEYVGKSAAESFLDEKLSPIDVYAIDIYRSNLDLARSLPSITTVFPTTAGHKYPLKKHPDIPGVLQYAVLRKNPTGGLFFDLQLADSEKYFGERAPELTGSINLAHGRANIEFSGESQTVAVRQRWILENVLLQLVRASIYHPLGRGQKNEIEDFSFVDYDVGPYTHYRAGRESNIVHIGVTKGDGAPGEFTDYANQNYVSESIVMREETGGADLFVVNEAHRDGRIECRSAKCNRKQNVTWNIGWDPPEGTPPELRKPPEKILVYSEY